uniref:Uncharacterized protein n=1 Tax=Anguilla anguilla TaxID=7936 RepID=A0A0E9VQY8_ANGAN
MSPNAVMSAKVQFVTSAVTFQGRKDVTLC